MSRGPHHTASRPDDSPATTMTLSAASPPPSSEPALAAGSRAPVTAHTSWGDEPAAGAHPSRTGLAPACQLAGVGGPGAGLAMAWTPVLTASEAAPTTTRPSASAPSGSVAPAAKRRRSMRRRCRSPGPGHRGASAARHARSGDRQAAAVRRCSSAHFASRPQPSPPQPRPSRTRPMPESSQATGGPECRRNPSTPASASTDATPAGTGGDGVRPEGLASAAPA